MAYEIVSLGDVEKQELPQASEQQPNFLQKAGGLAVRGIESLAGFPADVAQGITSLLGAGAEKLTGVPAQSSGTIPVPQKPSRQLIEKMGAPVVKELPLPTSENLRSLTKLLTGETFEPASDVQKNLQEFVGTLAPTIFGGVGAVGKSVIPAATGQFAKFAAEKLDVPEEYQEPIKIGTMLFTSLIGQPNAKKFASNLYEKARGSLPEDASISAKKLSPKINDLRDIVDKRSFKEEPRIIKLLDKIEKSYDNQSRSSNARLLWELKKDAVEAASEVKSSSSKNMLNRIGAALKESLVDEFKTDNKEFVDSLQNADSIWTSLKEQKTASGLIGRSLDKIKDVSPLTKSILGVSFPAKSAIGLGLYGGLRQIQSVGNNITSLIKHPGVRHYYKQTLENALKNNPTALVKSLKGLNAQVEKHPQEADQGSYEIVSL